MARFKRGALALGGGRLVRAYGRVATSSPAIVAKASSRELPHIAASGRSDAQNAGRSGLPNRRQR